MKTIQVNGVVKYKEQGFPCSFSERDDLIPIVQYTTPDKFIPSMGMPEGQLIYYGLASENIMNNYKDAQASGYCTNPDEYIYYLLGEAEDCGGEGAFFDIVRKEFNENFEPCVIMYDNKILEEGYIVRAKSYLNAR